MARIFYRSVLLMESFREGGKVRHRTVANLSKVPDDAVAAFDAALKGKQAVSFEDFMPSTGRFIGGIAVIKEIASRLGILKALGGGTAGSLAAADCRPYTQAGFTTLSCP